MDAQLGSQAFFELIHRHWLSALFFCLTLLTVLILVGVRWWIRRRLRRLLEERFEEENELDILPSPGPKDREAMELIRQFRQDVWNMQDQELQLSVELLIQHAIRIIRSVAGVYHPEVEIPQYEASLTELLQMIRRVSTRLSRLASAIPFKYLGNRRLSDYQRYYQVYLKINENPVVQLLKRNPHIYRLARLAMNVKNIANPIYWAGRELSREGYFYVLRWFYLSFTSQVGREAIRLYSGRHFQTEEDRDAALVCYRLFALTKRWGGPGPEEWRLLVDFVAGHAALESETKLHILSRWSQDRLPKDLEQQRLQTRSGLKWYQQGLQKLLEADPDPEAGKLELIRREMEAVE